MIQYAIIETDDGVTIIDHSWAEDADVVAEEHGGTLADGSPFTSYEDAYDALLDLQGEEQDRE